MLALNYITHFFRKNPILASVLSISMISLVTKVIGYIEKVVLAYYYGTSDVVDAYLVAFGIITSIFIVFRELVEPGFLRIFTQLRQSNKVRESWKLFAAVFAIIGGLAFVVSLFITLAPGLITSIFAPGFEGEKQLLTEKLLSYSGFSVLFLSLTSLTYITLNGLKKFKLPAASDLLFKALLVVFIVLLANQLGIVAAAIGLLIGSATKLGMQLLALKKYVQHVGFQSKHLKPMAALTLPLLIGILFSQASQLADNGFASLLGEGKVSALNYAKRIIEMPIVVFPYMLGIVIFPHFSELASQQKHDELKEKLGNALKWISVIFIPISILMFFDAEPITRILLERGEFDHQSTLLTSAPLAIYAFGITFFAIETVLVLFYFACGDTRTPIGVGILAAILNMIITYFLIDVMDYLGIALALVLSKGLKVLVLLYLLRKKIQLEPKPVSQFIGKLLICYSGFLASFILAKWISVPDGLPFEILAIGAKLVVGSVAFILLAYLFKLPMFSYFWLQENRFRK